MIEFGLLPSFVTTRQIKVRLRPCHSRLIAPCAVSLWIFAQPCGRPGRWCSVGIKSNRRSCGSVMIFSRSDPRPVVMTWITVCISNLGSTGNQVLLQSRLAGRARPPGAPNATTLKQRAVHHVNIDVSIFRMAKRAVQRADDLETELLPKTNRRNVRRNHEIKLYRAKTEPPRFAQTMLRHGTTDPLPARAGCDHERCIRDMRAAAGLVRPQDVCASNALILPICCLGRRCAPWEANGFPYRLLIKFRHVRVCVRRKPVRQRILA